MFHGCLVCDLIITRHTQGQPDRSIGSHCAQQFHIALHNEAWRGQALGSAKDGWPSTQHDSYGNCLQKTLRCLQFQSLTWTQDVRLLSTFNLQDVHPRDSRFLSAEVFEISLLERSGMLCKQALAAAAWQHGSTFKSDWKSCAAKRRP